MSGWIAIIIIFAFVAVIGALNILDTGSLD
jgi:hypothetical protein